MVNATRLAIDELTEDACWQYLADTNFGRLAVYGDQGIDIFPVNFLVRNRVIFFRSAPGSKLVDLTAHPGVAFEVDDTERHSRWSVVVKGLARRLGDDQEIEESGVLELHSSSPTEKWNYVQIVPTTITGRRFAIARGPLLRLGRALR